MIETLSLHAVTNRPRQGRSLASFERMVDATRELLLEKGSEDFTLLDVSERGRVSIGSIYLRFESKERLLHAVIGAELAMIVDGEAKMVSEVRAEAQTLRQFLVLYVARYSAMLENSAPMLRAIMQRASSDSAVSAAGKEAAFRSFSIAIDAMLQYRDEIRADDAASKANAAMHVIFASVARQHGLGSTAESSDPAVKALMATELAEIAYAYLHHAE